MNNLFVIGNNVTSLGKQETKSIQHTTQWYLSLQLSENNHIFAVDICFFRHQLVQYYSIYILFIKMYNIHIVHMLWIRQTMQTYQYLYLYYSICQPTCKLYDLYVLMNRISLITCQVYFVSLNLEVLIFQCIVDTKIVRVSEYFFYRLVMVFNCRQLIFTFSQKSIFTRLQDIIRTPKELTY